MTPTTKTQSAPAAPAPFSEDDPRMLFAKAVALGTAVIGTVQADQLEDPTPCDQYTVHDIVGHLVGVLRSVSAIGRGEDPFSVTPLEPASTPAGWLDAWRDAAHDARAAWTDDAAMERIVVLPWSQVSGGETLRGYLNEVTVHTWDLATAIGQRPAWDDQVVEAAFAAIRTTLPAEGRTELFEAISRDLPADRGPFVAPFAAAVDVAADAPAIDRLIAWNGRRPR